MTVRYVCGIVLFFTVFISFRLLSQQTELPAIFHFQNAAQGLASEFNWYITQDSEGFVWVSSLSGLNRFDGRKVRQYHAEKNNPASLFSDNIQSRFYEDKERNLWFCSHECIQRYNRNSDDFTRFFIKDSTGIDFKEDYKIFGLERDSFLWLRAGVKGEVFRFPIYPPHRPEKFFTLSKEGFFPRFDQKSETIYFFDYENNLQKGITGYFLKGSRPEKIRRFLEEQFASHPQEYFKKILFANDTALWLSTNNGMAVWNFQKRKLSYPHHFPKGEYHLTFDKQQTFWVAERNQGLFKKYQNAASPLKVSIKDFNSFAASKNALSNIYIDPQQTRWLSFYENGIAFSNPKKKKFEWIEKFPLDGKNTNYQFSSFAQDDLGRIWCTTYFNGLFLVDQRDKTTIINNKKVPGYLQKKINHVFKGNDGIVWFCTSQGIAYFDSKTSSFHLIKTPEGLHPSFMAGVQLRNEKLIFTNFSKGIYELFQENNTWQFKKLYDSNNRLYAMLFEDSQGQIFANANTTEIEVFRWNEGRLQLIKTLPVGGFLYGFYEDKMENSVWLATSTGLAKVKAKALDSIPRIYTEKDGLPSKNVMAILADATGNFWLSTDRGLSIFKRRDDTFHNFSLSDGMHSSAFHARAAVRLHNGKMWFGGENGITIVDPDSIHFVKTLPKCKITQIKINDELKKELVCAQTGATNISEIKEIRLPFSENTLSFEFVAIEYSDPQSNQLAYKMEGADDHWVVMEKGAEGFSRYSNLRPGSYLFKIKGANSDGFWNEKPAVLKVVIMPPFYATWWFISLSIFTVSLLIFLYYQWRIRQVREKAELKTRIAENKMEALRAQMNPHFIFNSLHSINSFILRQDNRNASEYLTQFAKLIRMILEHSRQSMVSLEKEIELLELYMKAEAKRLKNPFTYAIEIDDALDMFDTELPSILLQPFIENAVWHGVSHRDSAGHILLGFYKENGFLKCVVEDNGVGRAKAEELKKAKGKSHQSLAMKITEERLKLLYPQNAEGAKINIIDLLDENGQATGTRVEIRLPLTD